MTSTNMSTIYDVMSEKQLTHILNQATGSKKWELVDHQMKPAADGLLGFVGDHFKVTLEVEVEEEVREVRLFVKCLPLKNEAKAKFIDELNFFKRESMMYQLFGEIGGGDGPAPWHAQAFCHSPRLLVMPDLTAQGYDSHPCIQTFDLPHTLVVAASTARYHAALTNYAAKKTINGKRYRFKDEHGDLFAEVNFIDNPWLRAAAAASTHLIKTFSAKYKDTPDLGEIMMRLYLEACDSLKDYPGTLNVLLHKDLWANNMMFWYEDGVPTNAVLVDFQCVTYGPPAFDVAMMLYLTTSRSFREKNEMQVLEHYFKIFWERLEDSTKLSLREIGYDFDEFVGWYEKGRMFGLVIGMAIFPFGMMDPKSAQALYDDPETFDRVFHEDRSAPVADYCRRNPRYRDRLLHANQEFLDRYLQDKTDV